MVPVSEISDHMRSDWPEPCRPSGDTEDLAVCPDLGIRTLGKLSGLILYFSHVAAISFFNCL